MSETLALAWAWSESSSPVSCSELMSESVDCCDCCLLGVGDRDEKPESELELQDRSDLHAAWSRCPLLGGLRNVRKGYFIVQKYYCFEYFISYLQYKYHTNISNGQQQIYSVSLSWNLWKTLIFCIPANIRINLIIDYSSCFMYVLHAKERKDKIKNTDDMPKIKVLPKRHFTFADSRHLQ